MSSGAAQPPGGTSRLPPSLHRSTASKGRFLIPLVVRELAQLSHPYTSTTRGRASSPRLSGTVPQSRSQGPAPPAPRAGSPCSPCACGTGAVPRPPPRRGHPRSALRPRRGGGWLVLGSWGLRGDEFSGVGVYVVELGMLVVVVVGVVRRHLLVAGGMHRTGCTSACGGAPLPSPLPSPRPPPQAPMPRPVCPQGPTALLPLPLGPLPAPTPLSPCPCRRSRPLSPAPWPALLAPVPVPCPCPCPWLRPRSPTVPRSAP